MRRFVRQQAAPRVREGVVLARQAADEVTWGVLGREFENRLRRVEGEGTDAFGFDPETAKYFAAAAAFFHKLYFRVEVEGIDRVPQGRVMLVANHSGQIPLDGILIGTSMFFEARSPRFVRSMVEKWTQTLPFVGTLFQRVGQVVGVPENARRLLEAEEAVLVFPEGARGVSKPFRDRYQLQAFGLGFMRLALETGTPIVPVAVVGHEEQYINLGNAPQLAKILGMPVFPVVPQWFIPGAQMPLPTKVRIYFGEPMRFEGDPDDEDAVVNAKVQRVKDAIDAMLRHGLRERTGVFR